MDSKYVAGTPEIARFDFSRVNASNVDKTQRRVELCAEYLWNLGSREVAFASLTKKQKLDIVAAYLEQAISDAARTQLRKTKQSTANADADAEFEAN